MNKDYLSDFKFGRRWTKCEICKREGKEVLWREGICLECAKRYDKAKCLPMPCIDFNYTEEQLKEVRKTEEITKEIHRLAELIKEMKDVEVPHCMLHDIVFEQGYKIKTFKDLNDVIDSILDGTNFRY
jgi:hypothetical protein